MHETENALLYLEPPPAEGERVGLLVDVDALRALDEHDDGEITITAHVVDDRGAASIARVHRVLEVARSWFGPVEVQGPVDGNGRVRVLDDGLVRLRVGARLHVPAKLRGGVEQQ
jgi:hypothetical protein